VQKGDRAGYALAFLAPFVWSLTSPGLSYLLTHYHVPALTLAFWRDAVIAAACLAAIGLLRPPLLRATWRELASFAVIGAVSIGIYHGLWIWSVALNGAAVAVVMIFLYPTFVSIGSRVLFREPLRWQHVVALALSLTGCALIVRLYDPAVFRANWLGALVGLLTALTHSVYVLFSQRSVQSRSPWTSLTYTFLFGSLVLLALTLLLTPGQLFAVGETAAPWLAILFISLGPTLGGYAIFTLALRSVPSKLASLIAVLEVPLATLIAVLFLGERLEWPQALGIALILIAIILPQLLRSELRRSDSQAARQSAGQADEAPVLPA
jgi:drug/metabolite transporter (DMT)-like permease